MLVGVENFFSPFACFCGRKKELRKHAMVDYDRATVAKVYEEIEADLKLGITLVNDRFYRHPKFHFNKKAAYAFASRFYLHKGEWQGVHCVASSPTGIGIQTKPFLVALLVA